MNIVVLDLTYWPDKWVEVFARGSVIPSVLEEVAPTIRMLQGNSLCIHARADDMESGFTIQWDVNATETLEMKEAIDFQMWKWKGIFDCADVSCVRDVCPLLVHAI